MKKENLNNKLVIVLSEHPALGILLTPYMVQAKEGSDELLLVEQAFHLPDKIIKELNPTEQEARQIHDVFLNCRTVHTFVLLSVCRFCSYLRPKLQ